MIKIEINEESVMKFWNRVNKTKSCWLWTGPRRSSDYGAMAYKDGLESAHRFSYMLHYKKLPKGMWVLHKCDTPLCVNPKHLFLGTPADNERDMRQKGRKAKVTWLGAEKKQIPDDLVALLGKMHDVEIAKLANMNNKTIARIREDLGIPAKLYAKKPTELPKHLFKLLGLEKDKIIAERAGCSLQIIRMMRKKHGIESTHWRKEDSNDG